MPEFNPNDPLFREIINFSKQSAVNNLLESGVEANFMQEMLDILKVGISTGAEYNDLLDELQVYTQGDGTSPGALERYIGQVASDAITQFTATYTHTVTQELGF